MFGTLSYHSWHIESMRYLVLNPEDDDLSTFDLELDKGVELRKVYITLFSPSGSIQQFGLPDMNVEKTAMDRAGTVRVSGR